MKKKTKLFDKIAAISVWSAMIITFGSLIFIVGYILIKGVPYIEPSLFSFNYTTENSSLMPALITTIIMVVISLAIAVPLGVFAAIYLVEYAKRGNKIVNIISVTTETLAGIPSIVYGLFGMLFFVTYLNWGFSILSGAFTLGIMILPLIIRTAEEALKAVSDSYREGSFGLGAGRLRTVFKIILPSASSGILAGIILSVGRIIGETAALIYTAGTVAQIPQFYNDATGQFFYEQSARTLSVHMWSLSTSGLYMNQAYATGVVLLILVVGINAFSSFLAKRLTKEKKNV